MPDVPVKPINIEGPETLVHWEKRDLLLPPDIRWTDTDSKSTVKVGYAGLSFAGEDPWWPIDMVGLRMTARWSEHLPGRSLRPHLLGPEPTVLICGTVAFAEHVLSQNQYYKRAIIVTPEPNVMRQEKANIYTMTYTREMLNWCCGVYADEKAWLRPLAEARALSLPNTNGPRTNFDDETNAIMLLDSALGIQIDLPKIGIAINHYNRAGFSCLGIWAAVNQYYPSHKLVVAVVDDGSEEDQWAILKRTWSSEPRIRLKRLHHNTGVANSWNVAMRMLPDCDYITYTSSDNAQALGQAYHLMRWLHLQGGEYNAIQSDTIYIGKKPMLAHVACRTYQDARRGWGLGPSFYIPRDIAYSSGLLHEAMLYVEDTVMTGVMIARGLKPTSYPRPLYYYYWGAHDSLTHTVVTKYGGWTQLLQERFQRLEQEGIEYARRNGYSTPTPG